MEWEYVKPLKFGSIEEFETLIQYTFSDSFKSCIKLYNGGRPECATFNTDKKIGRELKSFLSFNREDKETVWKAIAWDCCKGYIPFAIDHFGNLICFDRSGQIVFINHETLEIEAVASSFDEFIQRLEQSKLAIENACYFKDNSTGNIVRRVNGYGVECLRKGSLMLERCGAASNYYREIFLGEGNHCLDSISREEALQIMATRGVSENREEYRFVLTDNYYEANVNGVVVQIKERNYNEKSVAFALNAVELYRTRTAEVVSFVVEKIKGFYESRFSADEIKARLNEPRIRIYDEKAGSFTWLNHQLDEHIIECEFGNDLQMFNVTLDG